MYAMTGKLAAQSGKKGQLIDILLHAAEIVSQLPGCRLYMVNENLADDTSIIVMEIWDDKASHDASLKDERVRSLISKAMPLMGGKPESVGLNVVGGYGLES